MIPDLTTLRDLLARTQAATGPDEDLDRAIAYAFSTSKTDIPFTGGVLGIGGFTSSLDAAIRLAEQFGIVSDISRHPWDGRNEFFATVRLRMPGKNGRISLLRHAPMQTRPLAVMLSLIGNLVAKLEMDAEDRAEAPPELAETDTEPLP